MSITVIVTEEEPGQFGGSFGLGPTNMMATGKPYMAHVASNPELRAQGRTADEAVENLKTHMRLHMRGKFVKIVEVEFEDLLVQEVMES